MLCWVAGRMAGPGARRSRACFKRTGCVAARAACACTDRTDWRDEQPISWRWGQAKPTQNEYSWTNLSHMLWVEQPVGTGFSQGQPNVQVCHRPPRRKLYLTRPSPAERGPTGWSARRVFAAVLGSLFRAQAEEVLCYRGKRRRRPYFCGQRKPVLMSLCSTEAFMFLVGPSVACRSNLGAEAHLQISQTISIITLASWILTCKVPG